MPFAWCRPWKRSPAPTAGPATTALARGFPEHRPESPSLRRPVPFRFRSVPSRFGWRSAVVLLEGRVAYGRADLDVVLGKEVRPPTDCCAPPSEVQRVEKFGPVVLSFVDVFSDRSGVHGLVPETKEERLCLVT
jgi:hypothetical protein